MGKRAPESDSRRTGVPAALRERTRLDYRSFRGRSCEPQPGSPARSLRRRGADQRRRPSGGRLVKVDTAKLDYLVDMVGEMVIAQSLVRHDPDLAAGFKPRLARNLSQLARITDEVQKTAMSMRMVPIGQLFQKMPGWCAILSQKGGKQVDLELAGEETELDRNIVEELADPLMHMVRNAVDHGIEPPDERAARGQSRAAAHADAARRAPGGPDRDRNGATTAAASTARRFWRKAREKGLIEPARA